MEQKLKLLLNLEENLFHLVQKRCYRKETLKVSDFNQYNKIKHLNLDLNTSISLTNDYIVAALNIQLELELNKQIVNMYEAIFGFELIDIDILNLIVKYISTCGNMLEIEMQELFGVRVLDFQPKNTVRFLDPEYIINKYPKGYGFGISDNTITTFKNIFLNILIPFANAYLLSNYRV